MQLRSGKITKTNVNTNKTNNTNSTNNTNNHIESIDYTGINSIYSNKQLVGQIDIIFNSGRDNKVYRTLTETDKTLMVKTIKQLLAICEYTNGRENKLPIAILMMTLLTTRMGKTFVKAHYNFNKTVYYKLIEFIGDETIDSVRKGIFIDIHNEFIDSGVMVGERIDKNNIKLPKIVRPCSHCRIYH